MGHTPILDYFEEAKTKYMIINGETMQIRRYCVAIMQSHAAHYVYLSDKINSLNDVFGISVSYLMPIKFVLLLPRKKEFPYYLADLIDACVKGYLCGMMLLIHLLFKILRSN